ncbi:hypothetical protein MRX96_034288 [Rhipicephalus microplus]
MAVRTNVDGVETLLTPVLSEDGSRIPQGDGFAYSAPDGTVITLVFENGPQQQNCDDRDYASQRLSDVPLVAPSQASEPPSEPELWSERKTRFLINKYKELKDLVGKKGGFRTKKALWQTLAEMISREFECLCSPLQVQNKWKSLERAYKRTKSKNNSSGSGRVSCEFEEELSDVLEKEHHITPTVLITPGRVIEKNRDSHNASGPSDHPPVSASEDAEPARPEGAAAALSGSEEPAEHEDPAAAEEASSQPLKKRKRVDCTPIQCLLQEFRESRKERGGAVEGKDEPS